MATTAYFSEDTFTQQAITRGSATITTQEGRVQTLPAPCRALTNSRTGATTLMGEGDFQATMEQVGSTSTYRQKRAQVSYTVATTPVMVNGKTYPAGSYVLTLSSIPGHRANPSTNNALAPSLAPHFTQAGRKDWASLFSTADTQVVLSPAEFATLIQSS